MTPTYGPDRDALQHGDAIARQIAGCPATYQGRPCTLENHATVVHPFTKREELIHEGEGSTWLESASDRKDEESREDERG